MRFIAVLVFLLGFGCHSLQELPSEETTAEPTNNTSTSSTNLTSQLVDCQPLIKVLADLDSGFKNLKGETMLSQDLDRWNSKVKFTPFDVSFITTQKDGSEPTFTAKSTAVISDLDAERIISETDNLIQQCINVAGKSRKEYSLTPGHYKGDYIEYTLPPNRKILLFKGVNHGTGGGYNIYIKIQ